MAAVGGRDVRVRPFRERRRGQPRIVDRASDAGELKPLAPGHHGEPPVAELRRAVAEALAGDWQAAHLIAQKYEDDDVASWIHAVVHRMEGDLTNARYWYRRVGRDLREDVGTAQELREIEALLAGR